MKLVIDTNVIIDALTSREPWKEEAEQIFYMAANQLADMYITASSATDIYYIVRKHLQNTQDAKEIMGKLYELFHVLTVTESDCIEALASQVKDYEDAVVEQAAKANRIDYIVTRNLKDYNASVVRAVPPREILTILEDD